MPGIAGCCYSLDVAVAVAADDGADADAVAVVDAAVDVAAADVAAADVGWTCRQENSYRPPMDPARDRPRNCYSGSTRHSWHSRGCRCFYRYYYHRRR